ncbi:DUF309 domain-containing protein [Hoyosella subflava]|uniref:DUF309 domain-containing protein n=1 Tax=Hoyosella subflava (strain DSM 45089 / JCM 17490 / NBRC 109087 / DQS3-9A1) TaxID=443218 RepID=F6ELV2_HOYSD|nr:hypothetical protein AS9A_3105 [Hoyosella subflava DQS3-9A1]
MQRGSEEDPETQLTGMDEARDRDESGRARNARPRDALGRPLPYGSPGVPRLEEGRVRTPEETLAEAAALLDQRLPFHAHEVFEDAWKSAPEQWRGLWKGLAQLAVGVTHAARGNLSGASRLLTRAAEHLEPFEATKPFTIDVDGLRTWSERQSAELEAHSEASPVWLTVPPLTGR